MGDANVAREERAVRRLDTLGYLLDNSIRIPGTGGRRIGIDAVIGLVPGFGDAAGSVLSAYIVVQAARLGVPVSVILRMLLNVGVEAIAGAVPILGDLFDAGWKANARNVRLLRNALDAPGRTRRSSLAVVGGTLLALIVILGGMAVLAVMMVAALWRGVTG
ncbi:MAG TPA: DUF4112 domain-containing protein [Longimicrobium sp.]|nr:DUF4112 domain-containing protein [Longimicrobium sp.]